MPELYQTNGYANLPIKTIAFISKEELERFIRDANISCWFRAKFSDVMLKDHEGKMIRTNLDKPRVLYYALWNDILLSHEEKKG